MNECPCGSGHPRADCCGPVIDGERRPATAEALMRARYTAHTEHDIAFIVDTHDPATRDRIDREETLRWAREAEWLGLDVHDVTAGGDADGTGRVEFSAHYRERGVRRIHHELAVFGRDEAGHWCYLEGRAPERAPVRRTQPRIGRNEPCPCGSGRKYKKCCGA